MPETEGRVEPTVAGVGQKLGDGIAEEGGSLHPPVAAGEPPQREVALAGPEVEEQDSAPGERLHHMDLGALSDPVSEAGAVP